MKEQSPQAAPAELQAAEDNKQKIPLEARRTYVDQAVQTSAWLSAGTIAETIDANERWVYRIIKELDITPEQKRVDNNEMALYPPWVTDVLREELSWRQSVKNAPEQMNIEELSDYLGRSRGWTQKAIEELGIRPLRQQDTRRYYGKKALHTLRTEMLSVPLDNGWVNMLQLISELQCDRDWATRRLNERGLSSQKRRSSTTGRIHDYFPPEARAILLAAKAERSDPGGTWLTATAISAVINKSLNWTNRRLTSLHTQMELRQDDQGVDRAHYPPEIVEILQDEIRRIEALPEMGDYISIHVLARKLGHATLWAEQQTKEANIQPEVRKDKKGRPQSCYPPSAVDALRNFVSQNPPEQPAVTASDLQAQLEVVTQIATQLKDARDRVKRLTEARVSQDNEYLLRALDARELLDRQYKTAKQKLGRMQLKSTRQSE